MGERINDTQVYTEEDFLTKRKGPKGKMIIGGGILAGMVQAIMLASAGYGDDDPPEFVREKNFIILHT